jgi:hypothetical protein
MEQRSQREEMNAAIRAQRERQNAAQPRKTTPSSLGRLLARLRGK